MHGSIKNNCQVLSQHQGEKMVSGKTYWDELPNELLAEWIVSEHFERFEDSTLAEIAEAYIGVYSTRPTSWLAVLARNRSIDRTEVLSMETDPALVRIPGMRRSKFLLPQSLAATVFGVTRLSLADHEWRLRDVKLTLADYRRILPSLTELTTGSPVRLKDIGDALGLSGPQTRACTTVATYDGALIRIPSSNPWSNRWLYTAAPNGLLQSDDTPIDRERLQLDIARRYIQNYGPVSVDDLAWWMAISKKTARLLLERAGAYEIGSGIWLSANQKDKFEEFVLHAGQHSATGVRFLPAWDPLLMGYAPGSRQRDCLGLNQIGGYDAAGNGRPVVLIGSRAETTWRIMRSGSKRLISLDLSSFVGKERKDLQESVLTWANQIGAIYDHETNGEEPTTGE
ncbi:hypothetical protein BUN12_1699 [Bacillus amyloliquefaciens]|uniref:DNA glycosylase AlkZ-like family protein n=1 Tax=Bacillus amyloliquefaciens TaxID=1390 RepID=UPI000FDF94AA|nr:crosslink repair DNA glycosylase YcaQ family protein [Bacillus amyloliquefaciens]AZV89955.1 hypothetical protein BUN12_1699 [Bacillus amyloliquefaciens]MEC1929825.1 crosslink repair DNA glycosylase YcaQ family protein [Bacillus amyloliquefaciens]